MYRVILTAMDANINVGSYREVLFDGHLFETRESAEIQMLHSMNDELSELNQPDAHNTPHTRVFIADLDGNHDATIRLWDGDDYWDVSYYDIENIDEEDADVAKYNKLQDTYGEGITVNIKRFIDDDHSIWYCYTSNKNGDSDGYTTAEQAYNEADCYLRGLGILW